MPNYLKKLHDRENGFTLIELLIVVLIIGILAAVAIPVYLGIQAQGHKAAVRADTNIAVKNVQVALTEGKTLADVLASPGSYAKPTERGETVTIAQIAGTNEFTVTGIESTNSTPVAGSVNYTYAYDSRTGKFTESDSGSGQPASLNITTTSLPDGVKDVSYSGTVAASGANTTGATQYTATGLPTTLSLNATTGAISGTPNAAGTYTVTVTATNGSATASQVYTLNVYSKPSVTSTNLPNATYNVAYSQTLTATGSPTPTISVTGLPAGLSFDPATNKITGTPTNSAGGATTIQITATNSAGSDTQSVSLPVYAPAKITSAAIPFANSGTGYSASFAATGYPSPTYSITGGSLSPSFNFNTGTGAVTSSNPTDFSYFQVTATNAAGSDNSSVVLYVLGAQGSYPVGVGAGTTAASPDSNLVAKYNTLSSRLGQAIGPRTAINNGGYYQAFQYGHLYWNSAKQTWYVIYNPGFYTWGPSGWENGAYGYPTGDPTFSADEKTMTQTFTGGTITTNVRGVNHN